MKFYNKYVLFLLIVILIGCEEPFNDPYDDTYFNELEYEFIGGLGGINHKTKISETGESIFIYNTNKQKYIVTVVLSKEQIDNLNSVLIDNNIFYLQDEYKLPSPPDDAMIIKISYKSSNSIKNIFFESGIDPPIELENIIWELYDVNNLIKSVSDYSTLSTLWENTETIKKWIFEEIKLERKIYHYSNLDRSAEILEYFDSIRNNEGYNVLFWDRDSICNISDGGKDNGYFSVNEVFPIKFWFNEFQNDITIVQNEGLVMTTYDWNMKNIFFENTYLYIIDKLEDGGKAIKVVLNSGEPYIN